MIRLFVSDIDGCLSEPYRPYDLDRLIRIRDYAGRAGLPRNGSIYPSFSICSGRAYAYVEAVTQVLGLQVPVLFEAGGGMFDPVAARTIWNPAFSDSIANQVAEVAAWMVRTCVPQSSMSFDYGKRTQAGLIGPDVREVARFVPIVEEYVAANFPELCVFHTPVSIDVAAPNVTKRQAMHWLAQVTEVPVMEMAFIGDTNGDIGAMEEVGFPLAPANGTAVVKASASMVMTGTVTEGVLQAYEWCVKHNGG